MRRRGHLRICDLLSDTGEERSLCVYEYEWMSFVYGERLLSTHDIME